MQVAGIQGVYHSRITSSVGMPNQGCASVDRAMRFGLTFSIQDCLSRIQREPAPDLSRLLEQVTAAIQEESGLEALKRQNRAIEAFIKALKKSHVEIYEPFRRDGVTVYPASLNGQAVEILVSLSGRVLSMGDWMIGITHVKQRRREDGFRELIEERLPGTRGIIKGGNPLEVMPGLLDNQACIYVGRVEDGSSVQVTKNLMKAALTLQPRRRAYRVSEQASKLGTQLQAWLEATGTTLLLRDLAE